MGAPERTWCSSASASSRDGRSTSTPVFTSTVGYLSLGTAATWLGGRGQRSKSSSAFCKTTLRKEAAEARRLLPSLSAVVHGALQRLLDDAHLPPDGAQVVERGVILRDVTRH
eukprot:scaffold105380_cov74-Phaeocystis_antarctica.AAC.5